MARQAKPDRTRQEEPQRELTQEQQNAIELLLSGETDQATAEAVGVTRQTVNGWRNHDALFAATLNERRCLLWAGYQDRMRALVGQALDVLEETLSGGDPKGQLAAARAILATADKLTPAGPIVAEKVAIEWDGERRVRMLERMAADMA